MLKNFPFASRLEKREGIYWPVSFVLLLETALHLISVENEKWMREVLEALIIP